MKLLFDQDLSYRIVEKLMPLYPDSVHVRLLGLESADDDTIWNFARANEYVIVSKDSDFHQRSLVLGFPPKVIWLRCGNCSTDQIEKVLRDNQVAIQEFCNHPIHSFLVLGPSVL